jgi:hypothetical protein
MGNWSVIWAIWVHFAPGEKNISFQKAVGIYISYY